MTRELQGNKSEEFRRATLPNDSNTSWATFDMGCSAALVSVGFELLSLEKSNPRKVQFVFRWEAGLEATIDDFWADKLEVKAQTFFNNIKMLKNRIYSE